MDIGERIDFNELSEPQQKDIIEKGYSIICNNTNKCNRDLEGRKC